MLLQKWFIDRNKLWIDLARHNCSNIFYSKYLFLCVSVEWCRGSISSSAPLQRGEGEGEMERGASSPLSVSGKCCWSWTNEVVHVLLHLWVVANATLLCRVVFQGRKNRESAFPKGRSTAIGHAYPASSGAGSRAAAAAAAAAIAIHVHGDSESLGNFGSRVWGRVWFASHHIQIPTDHEIYVRLHVYSFFLERISFIFWREFVWKILIPFFRKIWMPRSLAQVQTNLNLGYLLEPIFSLEIQKYFFGINWETHFNKFTW